MTKEVFQFGSRRIEYVLEFSKRKTLGITVNPQMQILVKAPEETRLEKIKTLLIKKAPWIIKQQSFFLSFYPKKPARRFVNGETHLYLGRQYQLRIEEGTTNKIDFNSRYMIATVKQRSTVGQVVKKWYREEAKIKFAEIAEPIIIRFEKYGVKPKGLYIQNMPTRWGSCTPGSKVILNPELLQAPKGCIEYVIVHELCHLVHHNHNRKFFELQEKELPEWEKWKRQLEKLLA
jgi:predicted metal-dependent hydrolase